jgi:hypothetical protein
MAVATIITGPTSQTIGNALAVGSANLPYRLALFPTVNYTPTEEDYFTGVIQFQTIYDINVSIVSNAGIGSAEGAVLRREYGSWAIQALGGGVMRSGKLEFLNQAIIITSQQYFLARNEAARQKAIVLADRPRFNISNSVTAGGSITGQVSTAAKAINLSGTVAPGGGILTAAGTVAASGGSPVSITQPLRGLKTDVTDGSLKLITAEAGVNGFPADPIATLGNVCAEARLDIYLLPGATGSIERTTIKLGEPFGTAPSVGSPYTPGTFPPL